MALEPHTREGQKKMNLVPLRCLLISMNTTYLIFGDLHGRVLPAFRLGQLWQREFGEELDGLLQVGDLGYFPDSTRLDKATKRHAERDPSELGVQLLTERSREADRLFAEEDVPQTLWFTLGNHEDYELLENYVHAPGCTGDDFPTDYYGRLRCIRDGHVAEATAGLRVGALWGIDGKAPRARRKTPERARISSRSATQLTGHSFHVLLTHDSPRDAIFPDSGSDDISALIGLAQPEFAFFGHYHGEGRLAELDFGRTRVYHLHGFEFRGHGGSAEAMSVGMLRYRDGKGSFEYLDPKWLAGFTRHNWQFR